MKRSEFKKMKSKLDEFSAGVPKMDHGGDAAVAVHDLSIMINEHLTFLNDMIAIAVQDDLEND